MNELDGIIRGECLLVASTKAHFEKTNTKVLEKLQTLDEPGLLLIFDEKTKIPENLRERCHIIDGLGKGLGQTSAEHAGSLVELSFLTNRELNKNHYSYIYLDHVNVLEQWNSIGDIRKFAHFMVNKLRAIEIGGVFVTEESTEEIFSQYVDGKIYL